MANKELTTSRGRSIVGFGRGMGLAAAIGFSGLGFSGLGFLGLGFLGLGIVTGEAEGQVETDAPPVLSGPRVETAATPGDLGVMNLDGSMQRLEVPAAEAAAAMLELDAATRVEVDEILKSRAAAIDDFVLGNMDLLTLLPTLRDPENRETRREVMGRIRTGLEEELAKGTLEARIAAVLPEPQRASFATMLETHR
ncbi:MAG: hypothetical protein AAF235_10255, partial [Planctomycetota bacterium]